MDKKQSIFRKPTYQENKSFDLATIHFAVPDQMLVAQEYHDSNPEKEAFLNQLRGNYGFVAIPADFEKGFDFYTQGEFCINIGKPQNVPQLATLFAVGALQGQNIKLDLKANLITLTENQLKQHQLFNEKHPPEYVCGDNRYMVILSQAVEAEGPEGNWNSFVFFIYHLGTIYQGNIYINAPGQQDDFKEAVVTWLSSIKIADADAQAAYQARAKKEALETCGLATESGELDALKAFQLFFDDVLFLNDNEVRFDGTHHWIERLQFNSGVAAKFPQVFSNGQVIGTEVLKLAAELEKEENLFIPREMYHTALQSLTWNQPITGITVLNLAAEHMIRIVEKEANQYVAAIDVNLLRGIPSCYDYIAELILALRRLNGKNGGFSAEMVSMKNLTGGLEQEIEQAVPGASAPESIIQKTVAENEHPYAFALNELRQNAQDEEHRKELEQQEYKQAYDTWRKECASIQSRRSKALQEKLWEEEKRLIKIAEDEFKAVAKKQKAIITEQTARKDQAEETLATLGIFKGKEKKLERSNIEDALRQIAAAEQAIEDAEAAFKNWKKNAAKKAKSKEVTFRLEIEKELLMPNQPQRPSWMPYDMDINYEAKQAIERFVSDGGSYTVRDLQEMIPELASLSNQRVSALCRQLVEAHVLKRTESGRGAWFSKA